MTQERMPVTKDPYQFLDQFITGEVVDGQFKKTSEVGGNTLTLRRDGNLICLVYSNPATRAREFWLVGEDGPEGLMSESRGTPNMTDKIQLVKTAIIMRKDIHDPKQRSNFDEAFDETLRRVIQTFGLNAGQLQTAL